VLLFLRLFSLLCGVEPYYRTGNLEAEGDIEDLELLCLTTCRGRNTLPFKIKLLLLVFLSNFDRLEFI
jgi:hypothetical protein